MAIPQNIKREHIEEALAEIDRSGEPSKATTWKYKLVHDNKEYSPKYAIRLANKYANGEKLTPRGKHGFKGGPDLENHTHTDSCETYYANCFLDSLGFEIRKKER